MTVKERITVLFITVLLTLMTGITVLVFGDRDQSEIGGTIAGLSAIALIILAPVFFDD